MRETYNLYRAVITGLTVSDCKSEYLGSPFGIFLIGLVEIANAEKQGIWIKSNKR